MKIISARVRKQEILTLEIKGSVENATERVNAQEKALETCASYQEVDDVVKNLEKIREELVALLEVIKNDKYLDESQAGELKKLINDLIIRIDFLRN